MTTRTKVAAATAAVIPFNCIICFEEFNLKNRFPVVLPCGHTFVCELCSKRLKRCMECRIPLYYTIPKKQPAMSSYNRGGGRYSPTTPLTPPQLSSTIYTQPQQKQQMPLPIPRNLVLITMMEAAKLQSKDDQYVEEQREDSFTRSDVGDDEELELSNVLTGIDMLSGPCGTYAAKEPLEFTAHEHRDPDEHIPDISYDGTLSTVASSHEIRQSCGLEKGSKIQVVSFKDGQAMLARGYGHVSAQPASLVKVSGPLDTSCRLEGMLNAVVEKSEGLKKELEKNMRIESRLREEISNELQKEPSYPIITFPPIPDESPRKDIENKAVESGPRTPTDVTTIDDINVPILKPGTLHAQDSIHLGLRLQSNILDLDDTELRDFSHHGIGHMAFPFCLSPKGATSSSSLPTYRRAGSGDSLNELGYGCTAFLGAGVHLFTEGDTSTDNHQLLHGPHESRTRSGSEGEHQQIQPSFTSSFDIIDFRTGLSGHRGLQNTHTSHSPTPRHRPPTRYMMSVHDGIGAHGANKKQSPQGTTQM